MKPFLLVSFVLAFSTIDAQIRKLQVEPNHSTVGFNIPIAGFSMVSGKFTDYKIDMDWNDIDIESSTIRAEIQVASINTGIPDRDQHLMTADFFHAEEYPVICFVSDSIQRINYAHFRAYGKITMQGITKDIILPFEIVKVDGNTIGIKSRSTINRLDYGVGNEFKHTSMPDFLSKKIEVQIDFWTKKRKE